MLNEGLTSISVRYETLVSAREFQTAEAADEKNAIPESMNATRMISFEIRLSSELVLLARIVEDIMILESFPTPGITKSSTLFRLTGIDNQGNYPSRIAERTTSKEKVLYLNQFLLVDVLRRGVGAGGPSL